MPDFSVPDRGVAVIRMSDWWVLLALGLLLPLSYQQHFLAPISPCLISVFQIESSSYQDEMACYQASEGRHVSEGPFCRILPRRHLRYKLGTPECQLCSMPPC